MKVYRSKSHLNQRANATFFLFVWRAVDDCRPIPAARWQSGKVESKTKKYGTTLPYLGRVPTESQIYGVAGRAFKVNFRALDKVDDIDDLLRGLFQDVLKKTDVHPDDMVGVEVRHPKLDYPILVPFRRNHTAEVIVRDIERVVQSNKTLKLDDGMQIKVTRIQVPSGSGKRKALASVDEFVANSRAIIDVPGDGRLCLPRAFVTAIAYVDNDPQWNSIRLGNSGRCRLQFNRAKELMVKAGMGEQVGPWDIGHVQQFQDCLQDYQIKVFRSPKCADACFNGPPAEKTLNLYLHNEHYMVVTKMAAFLNTNYYCSGCSKSNCYKTCRCCFRSKKCQPTLRVHCNTSNPWFVSRECFDGHKAVAVLGNNKRAKTMSICDKVRRCQDCAAEYRTRRIHTCNTAYCRFCEMQVVKWEQHQCYMKNYEPKEGEANGYIFFDFETQQTKTVEPNKYGSVQLQEPICVVVKKVCVKYWKERDMTVHCENCETRQRKFLRPNLLDNFVKWLFSSVNKGCIAMAHNNKGYDGQLILKSLHRNAVQCPEMIFKGLEIMRLKLNGVTLLDSLNFLPMPLSAMPAAFNLAELKKGYFPHLFSSMDNWNYIGQFPDVYFYQPATMKEGQKQKFFEW